MRLLTKTSNQAPTQSKGLSSLASVTSDTYEIPNGTVVGGVTILSIVATLAITIGNYLGNIPSHEANRKIVELKEKEFKVQVLQRVLENESEAQRAASLKLLIAADILEDSDGKILTIAKDSFAIPRWAHRELESVSTILNNHIGGSPLPGEGILNNSKQPSNTQLLPNKSDNFSKNQRIDD